MTRMIQFLGLGLVSAYVSPSMLAAATQSDAVKRDHVTVQAFAGMETVIPGQPFDLAVQIQVESGWHIYWAGIGSGTGLPTEVHWKAPPGFRLGRTQFPPPERYESPIEGEVNESPMARKSGGAPKKETANILNGTVILLTRVYPEDTVQPGATAEFSADVSWLVCKSQCIPGGAKVALSLPVGSKTMPAKSAHPELFKKARLALPLPQDKPSYVKLVKASAPATVKPNSKAAVTLTLEIKDKHHIQSDHPVTEGLIAASVFFEPTPGVEFDDPTFPKAHERTDRVLGKVSEFTGRIEVSIPFEVDSEAGAAPRWMHGVLQYQACTDSGTCYPPENVSFAIPVRMEGGPEPKSEEDGDSQAAAQSFTPDNPDADASAASPDPAAQTSSLLVRLQDWFAGFGLAGVIAAGFVGGLLLNLMPCVLPVISLKVLSFVRQSGEHRSRIFALGMTYSAGIILFYGVLALLFYRFNTGWGQLFQDPRVVIGLSAVVLAFALSLFEVFTVFTPRIVNELSEKAEGEGYLSAFGTGILATLLGTACTAPFLSLAIGYASRLGPVQGSSIFLAAGLGMASPFIILSIKPTWLKFVPKPGHWMENFERVMGFLLLGTVIWLMNALRGQIGDFGLLLSLIFLLGVAMAAWARGKVRLEMPFRRRLMLYVTATVILAVGWFLPFQWITTIPRLVAAESHEQDNIADGLLLKDLVDENPDLVAKLIPKVDWTAGDIPWQPYRRSRTALAVRYGYTVFVDYTADWCASCKFNLATSINREDVKRVMQDLKVIPYEADYTNRRPEITEDLLRFKRAGVPMYLVYSPGDPENPQLLSELLSPSEVIQALQRAGPSKPTLAQTLGTPSSVAQATYP